MIYCHTCDCFHTFSDSDLLAQEYEGHDLDEDNCGTVNLTFEDITNVSQ